MAFGFILGIFFIVLYDARLLKQKNESLYKKELGCSERQWAFLNVLLPILVLPIYLLRRSKFKRGLHVQEEDLADYPSPPVLLSDALGVILKWICCVVLVALLFEAIRQFFPKSMEELGGILLTDTFSSFLIVILIYNATKKYFKGSFWTCIGFVKSEKSMIKVVAASVSVGIVFAAMSSYILFSRKVQPATPLSHIMDTTTSPSLILLFIGLAVIFAPFFEEIVFRGYFFHVISRYNNRKIAFLSISLIFGLLHVGQYWGDWEAIGMVGLLGFALTFLRLWSGTTVASIITHYVYNASMVIVPVVMIVMTNPSYLEYQTKFQRLDFQGKEELLLKSISENPDFADAYNDLAWTYAEENKKLDTALKLVEKALARSPESYPFLDTKAEILFRMGRFEEAIEIEQKVVDNNPGHEFFESQLKKFKEAHQQSL